MRYLKSLTIVTMATLAVACGRSRSSPMDDALKSDLALASQVNPNNSQFISPTEAGYAPQPQVAPRTLQTSAARPSTATTTRRASTARRSSGSSSSGGYYPGPAPAPQTTVEKNTVRDAAIGAVAGAILGASTSRDKVKGGLIGAAAGGLLGGVIGNNVDVRRKGGW